LNRVFESHVAGNNVSQILTFICNNEHIYPITNEHMKKHISNSKKLNIQLLENKIDYTTSEYLYIATALSTPMSQKVTQQKKSLTPFLTDSIYNKLIKGCHLENKIFSVPNVIKAYYECIQRLGKIPSIEQQVDNTIMSFYHPISNYLIVNLND